MPSAEEIFAAACAPGGTKILGVRLRPVTIGHVVLLSRVGNSLACGGRESFDDLVSAVLILSRDWRGGLAVIERPPARWKMALWQRWCQFVNRLVTGDGTPLAYAPRQWSLLKEWFAGQVHPDNWPKFAVDGKSSPRQINTPGDALIVCGLMADLGMTFEQVMDTPYTLCRTLLAVNSERHGGGSCHWLESDEHVERREFLKRDYFERAGIKPEAN